MFILTLFITAKFLTASVVCIVCWPISILFGMTLGRCWSLCESGKGLVVVCGVFTEPVQCCGEEQTCGGQKQWGLNSE